MLKMQQAEFFPEEPVQEEEAPQEEAPQEEAPQEEAPQEEAPQEEAPQEEAEPVVETLPASVLFGKRLVDCAVHEVRHWLRHTEDVAEIQAAHDAEVKGLSRPNVVEAFLLRLRALAKGVE